MAVDYFSRLIVSGRHADVVAFRRDIHREYPRTVHGRTWTEIVPFSFASLYELAPAARRIAAEIPYDPYDLSAWPVHRIDSRHSEVRYQLHTRNVEIKDFVRVLSGALPQLTFGLATLCLDDGGVEANRASRGRLQKWFVPETRSEFHWERARRKFRLAGDDVYDDDLARQWAEDQMMAEALGHWDESGSARHDRPARGYRWWNRLPLRDLDTERRLAVAALAIDLEAKITVKARRTKRRVTVFRHDNPAAARDSTQTLTAVLSNVRRRRPRDDRDPGWTFLLGDEREYVAVSTYGPLAFAGHYPVWRGRTFKGCMSFQLTWDNVQSVLEKFYAGCHAAESFAGLEGSFEPYPRSKGRGRKRRQRRSRR